MGGQHVMPTRNVPHHMHMVGMQRMQQQQQKQNMAAYGLASQAAMGGGGAINPGNILMQRGLATQPHNPQQQQQQQVSYVS